MENRSGNRNFSRPMSRSAQEGSSSQAEPVALHHDDPGMPPGLCDRLGRSLDQRLELAIASQGKVLSDRGGQDSPRSRTSKPSFPSSAGKVESGKHLCAPRDRRARQQALINVRFGAAGLKSDIAACPKSANRRLMHRNKQRPPSWKSK
jgi:hypothetical protein